MFKNSRLNKITQILFFAILSLSFPNELFSQTVRKNASGKKKVVAMKRPTSILNTTFVDPPPQMPNWPRPITITESGPSACARLVDLNNDGLLEILGASDTRLHAWNLNGTDLSGWENGIPLNGNISSVAAVADIDGDYQKEIFITTEDHHIYAFKLDGTNINGWPIGIAGTISSNVSVSLCDINGDGNLEVIAPTGQQIHVLKLDGTVYSGWPFITNTSGSYGGGDIGATAAVGDLQGNGSAPEIVIVAWAFAFNEVRIYVLNNNGTLLSGWPKIISGEGNSYSAPTLADLDGNGDLEILISTGLITAYGSHIYAFNHDGTVVPGFPISWESPDTYAQPVVGDLDGNGDLEIFSGTHYYIEPDPNFYGWNHDGSRINNWPVTVPGIVDLSATLFDIDGDQNVEIFTADWFLDFFAFEFDGTVVSGFPFNDSGNNSEIGSPSVGDVDGDGDFELAFINHGIYDPGLGYQGEHVNLWAFNKPFYPNKVEWGTMHHDNRNTNLYEQPVTGSLQQNTTWWGRIKVRNTVTVPAGKTLNLQGGTTVHFASGAVLNISGQVKVTGSPYEPVIFDSNSNVNFLSGASVTLNPGTAVNVEGTLTIASGATITGGGSIVKNETGKIFVTNSATALASNNGRKIARGVNGNYHLVFETDDEICYQRMTNAGAITEFRRLSNGATDGEKSNPSIYVRDNNVLVVWQKLKTNGSHDITFHKSTDYGVTWPVANRQVIASNVGNNPPLPVIASQTANHVLVVYRTATNLSSLTSSNYGNAGTWGPITTVPSSGALGNSPSLAVTTSSGSPATGMVNATASGIGYIYYRYYQNTSWDLSLTNLSAVVPGSYTGHKNPSLAPSGTAGNTTLHVA